MADLKADAMRADLARLGHWDRGEARRRFLRAFVPPNTSVVLVAHAIAGCIAVRSETRASWIEHFYLRSEFRGRGLGDQVLQHIMSLREDGRPFMLAVNRGSRARSLYERHGFTFLREGDNGVDQVYRRCAV